MALLGTSLPASETLNSSFTGYWQQALQETLPKQASRVVTCISSVSSYLIWIESNCIMNDER